MDSIYKRPIMRNSAGAFIVIVLFKLLKFAGDGRPYYAHGTAL